jgi:hypothetical protein
VFKRFFGKKNDGFYLQIEDDTPKTEPAAKAKTKDVVAPAAATSTPVATAAPVAAATPTAGTTTEVTKTDKKAEEKAAKIAKKAIAKQAAAKSDAPKAETAAPVTVAVSTAPAITNFATDYLIKPSSISGRRRPGANMNGFLELARQVEKPKNFKAAASERKVEK